MLKTFDVQDAIWKNIASFIATVTDDTAVCGCFFAVHSQLMLQTHKVVASETWKSDWEQKKKQKQKNWRQTLESVRSTV